MQKTVSKKLTGWQMVMLSEALNDYMPPGLSDQAKADYQNLRNIIYDAQTITLKSVKAC